MIKLTVVQEVAYFRLFIVFINREHGRSLEPAMNNNSLPFLNNFNKT